MIRIEMHFWFFYHSNLIIKRFGVHFLELLLAVLFIKEMDLFGGFFGCGRDSTQYKYVPSKKTKKLHECHGKSDAKN